MSDGKPVDLYKELNAKFDLVSPMENNGQLVVYLPLDDNDEEPEPPGIGDDVINFLSQKGYNPRLDEDEQAVIADL